jgi:nucleoside 2-deoxyribosyltransferase
VRQCDIVLANCDRIEGGLGTAIEIGMALALGKEILLVCPDEESRYVWRFAVGSTPTVYSSLEKALEVIRYAAAQVSGAARCAAP